MKIRHYLAIGFLVLVGIVAVVILAIRAIQNDNKLVSNSITFCYNHIQV